MIRCSVEYLFKTYNERVKVNLPSSIEDNSLKISFFLRLKNDGKLSQGACVHTHTHTHTHTRMDSC